MEYQQPPQINAQKCPDDRKSSPLPGCPRLEEIVLLLARAARNEPNPLKVVEIRSAIAHLGEALKIK